jgi:hypothetical protein
MALSGALTQNRITKGRTTTLAEPKRFVAGDCGLRRLAMFAAHFTASDRRHRYICIIIEVLNKIHSTAALDRPSGLRSTPPRTRLGVIMTDLLLQMPTLA